MARLQKTITDYVIIAVNPVLIMLLIGSLVFFLVEVFYQGGYQSRLNYVFALFVMAAVLIGRISIEKGREYSLIFAAALGGATLLVLGKFVRYQGPLAGMSLIVNAALIGIVLWCADKLTWDCTVVDDSQDASGEGLLQTIGLDNRSGNDSATEKRPAHSAANGVTESFWQRFINRNRRPHTPGVWAVYFTLVGLPLFGIGQWFLPADDLSARRYVFRLLGMYLAAGLGLLLCTSFLGLRRYLRQRQVEMPENMPHVWIGGGIATILVLLIGCMLLPRPSAEYSITHVDMRFASSPSFDRTSKHGQGDDGEKPGDAPKSRRPGGKDGQTKGKSQSSSNESGGKKGGTSKDKQAGDDKTSRAKPSSADNSSAKDSSPKTDRKTDTAQSDDSPAESAAVKPQPDGTTPDADERDQAKEQPSSSQDDGESAEDKHSSSPSSEQPPSQRPEQTDSTPPQESQADSPPPPSSSFKPMELLNGLLGGVPYLLKGLYYLAFLAGAAYLVWKYWPQVKAALDDFCQGLRELWSRFFGEPRPAGDVQQDTDTARPHVKSFREFDDPFATGAAGRYSPEQLISYSFEAVEAWARDHGCHRGRQQTPHEFTMQIARGHSALKPDLRNLADLYCVAAYAGQSDLSPETAESLAALWQKLRAVP